MELFDECPAPFSPEMMMIIIDHDTNKMTPTFGMFFRNVFVAQLRRKSEGFFHKSEGFF